MFIAFKKSGKNTLIIRGADGRKSGRVVRRNGFFFAEMTRRVPPAEMSGIAVFVATKNGMSLARISHSSGPCR